MTRAWCYAFRFLDTSYLTINTNSICDVSCSVPSRIFLFRVSPSKVPVLRFCRCQHVERHSLNTLSLEYEGHHTGYLDVGA